MSLIDELEKEIDIAVSRYKGGQRKGGGYTHLAEDMNIRRSTFYSKINPDESTKSLTTREQIKLIHLLEADDPASVEYIKELVAETIGGRFVPLTARTHPTLQVALLKADEARNGTASEILKALSDDGLVDAEELKHIKRRVFVEEAEAKALIATVESKKELTND